MGNALELLRTMEERGIIANIMKYSAVTSVWEKGKQWEKTLELFWTREDGGVLLVPSPACGMGNHGEWRSRYCGPWKPVSIITYRAVISLGNGQTMGKSARVAWERGIL